MYFVCMHTKQCASVQYTHRQTHKTELFIKRPQNRPSNHFFHKTAHMHTQTTSIPGLRVQPHAPLTWPCWSGRRPPGPAGAPWRPPPPLGAPGRRRPAGRRGRRRNSRPSPGGRPGATPPPPPPGGPRFGRGPDPTGL